MNLNDVITATEAATLYGISVQAVRKACQQGWLPARKSGTTWLIDRADAEARWGKKATAPGGSGQLDKGENHV